MRTDAADGGCGGGLDFAPMHAVAPSRGFPACYMQYQNFFMGRQTWYFILNVIICHFSGGGMVMWTTTQF